MNDSFKWDNAGVKHAHAVVSAAVLHTTDLELSDFETSHDVKRATQHCIATSRRSEFMASVVGPVHLGGPKTKNARAEALGFDLGKEIEDAVSVLGVFSEAGVGKERDSEHVVRPKNATWKNIGLHVEKKTE